MNAESKKLLLEHIKKGQDVPATFLNIQRIMENSGTGLFVKACCSRIEEAGLVDGVHIFHEEPGYWNLLVDPYGMEKCRGILESYVYADELDPLYESFRAYNDWVISINNILYSVRKMEKGDLKKGLVDAIGYRMELDDIEDVLDLFKAELECRKLWIRLRKIANRVKFVYQALCMVRVPCRMLIPFVKESWDTWEKNGNNYCPEGDGKYSQAMRRFLDLHGGDSAIGKLRGDTLMKYIYLAVRAYGKEYSSEKRHRRIKPCREIENKYRALGRVMGAIGRLTPQEILRMYPVEKRYDGVKWMEKDYFHTMDKVNSLPGDEPIGDAQDVACLLWDYQNWDLEFLLMEWMSILGDLYIYCNDRDPNDKFHESLRRRHGKEETEDE